jgi:hypothetical protein
LAEHHELDSSASGEAALDDWLRRRARANQVTGASRTYVVCEGKRVAGYYALASGAISKQAHQAGSEETCRIPSGSRPCPAGGGPRPTGTRPRPCHLSRRFATRRVAQAADAIGIRGIVVHAISEDARRFYIALGFDPCPTEAMTLVATLRDLRAALGQISVENFPQPSH